MLDEPEQRLDTGGRRWLVERLIREKASGCAILMATHDDELVREVSDLTVEIGR